MKECSECHRVLALEAFHRNPSSSDGRRSDCKECRVDTSRWQRLASEYSLSRDQFYSLLEKQNGRCAICRHPLPKGTAVVDHCHETGEVRGLLCNADNLALGLVEDGRNILRIQSMLTYAERHHGKHQQDKP